MSQLLFKLTSFKQKMRTNLDGKLENGYLT